MPRTRTLDVIRPWPDAAAVRACPALENSMFPIQRPPSIALATLAGLVAQPAAASCGSAFCSVNTSAAFMGGDLSGATRADLRFEFIDQK